MHSPILLTISAARYFRTLAALGLIAVLFCAGNVRAASPDDHLWLKVDGSRIFTSTSSEGGERPFIPVGIGYARDVIIRAQDDAVMKFCKERGLNTVRLAFYTRYFNNKKDRPIDIEQHIKDHIDPVMAAARKHGLYVILDAHEYMSAEIDEATAREKQTSKGWDDETIQQWIQSWVTVAKHYKDDPYVLGYELLNEPHDIAAEDARKNYTRCIRAIREVDQRHILIVGNSGWSHARTLEATWGPVASTVDTPYNNIVFAFHDYPEDNHPWIVQRHITRFRDTHQVPVMCTEFGATHWNKSETVCREFLAGMHTLFAKEDVGWMIWALKKLEDAPRTPYNEVDKTGLGPPRHYDSCPYSDLWVPAARIMASPMPKPKGGA
ncbi:MAG: glycoside hydrolase family 5 protein [Rariglobus sp.]|nr:glycoside hydrolase family 5 protein [Rariglobus sp.]